MPDAADYRTIIEALRLLPRLAAFTPAVIGTPPLGIAVAGSDIDIVCYAPDLDRFAAELVRHFGGLPGFDLRRDEIRAVPSVVCSFDHAGWRVEIFGQAVPVAAQWGMRHFQIERRLLALFGVDFQSRVVALKRQGIKTEPAFAALLKLPGDPYEALLTLGAWTDDRLQMLWMAG